MRWLLQDKVAKPTCLRKYTYMLLIVCNLVVNCYCYSLLLRRKLFLWCIVGLWARCCINRWLIRRLSWHLIPFPSKSGHSGRSLEIGVKYFTSSLRLILYWNLGGIAAVYIGMAFIIMQRLYTTLKMEGSLPCIHMSVEHHQITQSAASYHHGHKNHQCPTLSWSVPVPEC